jgi:uncharacterized protein YbaR (Trm112 family)
MNSEKRAYGVDDELVCPECGARLTVTRRSPDSTVAHDYESQTLTCAECNYARYRTVDSEGNNPLTGHAA